MMSHAFIVCPASGCGCGGFDLRRIGVGTALRRACGLQRVSLLLLPGEFSSRTVAHLATVATVLRTAAEGDATPVSRVFLF